MTDFNELISGIDDAVFGCLGGELANIYRARDKNLTGVSVIVDRDVDVVSDNGLSVSKRTVLTFRKDQIACNLDEDDSIEMLDSKSVRTGECFTLHHVMSEDASIVQWYVRG